MSQTAIVSFAGSNGFSFSENELLEYCTELSDNMNSNHALDDESLAQAAGGWSTLKTIAVSIIGLGVACAVSSLIGEVFLKGGCKTTLSVSGGNECRNSKR